MSGRESRELPALRRSPTGRIPRWVLDEAAGLPVSQDTWRAWAPPEPQRRRRLRTAVPVVLVLALGIGAAGHLRPDLLDWAPPTAAPSFPHPTPGHESSDAPLGTPLPAPPDGGTYAFVAHQPDGEAPVAYDPCRPIHYVMRPDSAPVGGEQIVHEAFDRVSAVTGLRFVYDGGTDEQPSSEREPYQPDRYGDRWAPVLVSWQTGEENPTFLTDVAGEAGSLGVSTDGPRVYVTGTVALDEAAFDRMLTTVEGAAAARAVVLHELGHLVGLAHVDDAAELMYPSTSATYDFGSGDLTGLAALGRGECIPGL